MSKVSVEKGIIPIKTKVMVFGTFDGLHKGHVHFLKQARKLAKNSFVIVSIARDKNVYKIKGAHPLYNEKKRLEFLKKSGLADRVVLSGLTNHLPHIRKEHPDIIALGYDQRAYVENLKSELKDLNVKIVRLKSYKPYIYKNHLLHVAKS